MKNTCPCGGIILADTEDWETPLCHECWVPLTRLDIGLMTKELEQARFGLQQLDRLIVLERRETESALRRAVAAEQALATLRSEKDAPE